MLNIDLSGKTAFVAGGSGQLGRTIVETLASCGANVAVGYLSDADTATALVSEAAANGCAAVTVQLDVGDYESVCGARDYISEALAQPDIVVACASEPCAETEISELDTEELSRQYRASILQNVNLAKAFLPAMREKGGGRYIAVSGESAGLCSPGDAAKSAMQGGLENLVKCLAKEVGLDGVTVNLIAAGWVITEAESAQTPEDSDSYTQYVPLGRRGEAADVANAAAFLASNLAGFITGVRLPVTGGTVM